MANKYNIWETTEEETIHLAPQEGPQTEFLATSADIAIYGGAAGGGKTWGLLLEPLRYLTSVKGFGGVILRRTFPQIMNEGGLWDESMKLYPAASGSATKSAVIWDFPPYGNKLAFRHMQHESTLETDWQGSQIPFIGFDELTHFTKKQFFYMLSRNRSTCGVEPYIRAGCNPDANSWVKSFLAPWLDRLFKGPLTPEGIPIGPAKSGEIRYFTGEGGTVRWCSYEEYVHERTMKREIDWIIKSITFIRSSVFDNKKLLDINPGYVASLKALPLVEQERLLWGNWDIVEGGNMFRAEWFPVHFDYELPQKFKRLVAFFDLAGTAPAKVQKKKNDPDYSCCVGVAEDHNGRYYILDCSLIRDTPGNVEKWMLKLAKWYTEKYGGKVEFVYEEEPGSSGKFVTHHMLQLFKGYSFRELRSTGSKIARAKPISKACQGPPEGNVWLMHGEWNDQFLAMLTAFPNEDVHDDVVDALSGAYEILTGPLDKDMFRPNFAVVGAGNHHPTIPTYAPSEIQAHLAEFHRRHQLTESVDTAGELNREAKRQEAFLRSQIQRSRLQTKDRY